MRQLMGNCKPLPIWRLVTIYSNYRGAIPFVPEEKSRQVSLRWLLPDLKTKSLGHLKHINRRLANFMLR